MGKVCGQGNGMTVNQTGAVLYDVRMKHRGRFPDDAPLQDSIVGENITPPVFFHVPFLPDDPVFPVLSAACDFIVPFRVHFRKGSDLTDKRF